MRLPSLDNGHRQTDVCADVAINKVMWMQLLWQNQNAYTIHHKVGFVWNNQESMKNVKATCKPISIQRLDFVFESLGKLVEKCKKIIKDYFRKENVKLSSWVDPVMLYILSHFSFATFKSAFKFIDIVCIAVSHKS